MTDETPPAPGEQAPAKEEKKAKPREEKTAKPKEEAAARPKEGVAAKATDEATAKAKDQAAAKPKEEAGAKPKDEAGAKAKDEAGAKPKEEKPARPQPLPVPLALIGVVAGALALGGAFGGLFVGPAIVAARNARPAPADVKPEAPVAETQGGETRSGEAKGGEGKSIVFKLDNIIVNPAGSQGTRFLMASVAIQLPDDKTEETLRAREVEVRDAVTAVLESQTMAMLTRPGARDSLKQALARAVVPLAGRSVRLRVFLPQFVIQ